MVVRGVVESLVDGGEGDPFEDVGVADHVDDAQGGSWGAAGCLLSVCILIFCFVVLLAEGEQQIQKSPDYPTRPIVPVDDVAFRPDPRLGPRRC